MELISPRPLTGEMELKQELFLRAEELERLVAIYKLKLCGEDMASLNYGSKLLQQSNKDVLEDQRGQFYDIYMRKREEKLREEWRARGAEKEAELRAMMETLHSTSSTLMKKGKTMEPKYAHSSTYRISAATACNPAISSFKTASLRKENLKSSTGISNETTLQWSVARSQSSNDKLSLVKDIKARRSQSLHKNCVSLGEPKDFIHLNYNPDTSTQPMNTNPQRSGAQRPLHGKSSGTTPTAGISKAKSSNSQIQVEEYTELLKEGNDENRKPRISKESWNSAYHRFGSRSQFVASPKSTL
ncbi:uncharacterized protein LOC110033170 isoform X2 [Phalaenopsis equestris]|uniref:uncharacterized protein LOC110033170 isoform X2 n=1 Tax=Phalaenopsis equestris TaxID=78828 RepID=UPI0009E393CD|nr:uncharacterized protein LOC110033170 isoform X2 [Phalaenopsis equestris]